MKKIFMLFPLTFTLFIFGCLTFETLEVRIVFNENSNNEGTIEVTYTNIGTGESEANEQQDDFKELIKIYQDDQFLLDQLSDGIYIKKRELFEKDGKLTGKYNGIFRNLKFDNEELKTVNDELILYMDDGEQIVETNGKIVKTDNNVFISWSKNQKELYWKLKMSGETKTNSLLEMFQEWKTNQE